MSTKKLAKELGLLRQRSQSSGSKKSVISNQIFSYLIVIDFESTCWKEKSNHSQEIIEFPAVLLNASTGEIESEFHTYVQPQEHPMLSAFCTELTGITQAQVEAGIPLQICLSRFSRWLQCLQLQQSIVFTEEQIAAGSSDSQKKCTFLTWSDWDLGVCLQYECRRKQLHKPDVLNSWIDLRSTYRLFYNRKPKGLNGALQDLGIQFSGREHSGLDDARNTARLAARMMRDGCVMKITRTLNKTPACARNAACQAKERKGKSNTDEEERTHSKMNPASKIPLKSYRASSCSEDISEAKENSNPVQNPIQTCQSLISPKTLLNGAAKPQWGCSSTRSVTNFSSPAVRSCLSSRNTSNSLVLCSTTVDCISHLPQRGQQSKATTAIEVTQWENGEDIDVETEERCGSYDDVVLDYDYDIAGGLENGESDSGCYKSKDNLCLPRDGATLFSRAHITEHDSSNLINKKRSCAKAADVDGYFIAPNRLSDVQHSVGLCNAYSKVQCDSSVSRESSKTFHTPIPCKLSKPFVPEKTSTPHNSSVRPASVSLIQNPSFLCPKKQDKIVKSPFTICCDPSLPTPGGPLRPPRQLTLSIASANTRHVPISRPSLSLGGGKITAPLCLCGRRAKRQVVANGGPNHGRGFFCCTVRRSGSGTKIQKGCEFFKWESAVVMESPSVRSSVSLCEKRSSVLHRPPQRSLQRKSW